MDAIAPVTRTKAEAQLSYDRMSRWYDLLTAVSEKKYKDVGLATLAARDGERVLEIGFGTGQCLAVLAQSVGDAGKVYGVDLSMGMYAVAQARLRKAGLVDRTALYCADAANLPFEDGSFDAIFISFTLELFDTPEIPVVLAECGRVLAGNACTEHSRSGRLTIVALTKKEKSGTAVRFYEWVHQKMPAYVDCRPIYLQQAVEEAHFHIESATTMSMFRLPVDIVFATKKPIQDEK